MRIIILSLLVLFVAKLLPAQANSILVDELYYQANGSMAENNSLRAELQHTLDRSPTPTYGSLTVNVSITLEDERTISGMAKKTIGRFVYELIFFDRVLGFTVETINGQISGSGANRTNASLDAIKKLAAKELKEEDLQNIQILHYRHFSDCTNLLQKLNALRQRGELLGLLAVTNSLPEDSTCAPMLDKLVQEVYAQQQADACQATIIKAKAAIVEGDVRKAARILTAIDPSLDCAEAAEALLDQLIELKNASIDQQLNWYREYGNSRYPLRNGQRRVISNLILLQAIGNE